MPCKKTSQSHLLNRSAQLPRKTLPLLQTEGIRPLGGPGKLSQSDPNLPASNKRVARHTIGDIRYKRSPQSGWPDSFFCIVRPPLSGLCSLERSFMRSSFLLFFDITSCPYKNFFRILEGASSGKGFLLPLFPPAYLSLKSGSNTRVAWSYEK